MNRFVLALLATTFLPFSACAAEDAPQESAPAMPVIATSAQAAVTPRANNSDWRTPDPENTLYIKTKYGDFVIEMAPEVAPKHVAQIKKLARQKFYDGISFHRVIDGFMNQTGDPKGDGTGDSHLPDIQAEFEFQRPATMKVTMVGRERAAGGVVDTAFYKSFPIATRPIAPSWATKEQPTAKSWGLHCPGTTSMARGGHDVNSGNSQFFLMRSDYPSLNQQYSIWGMTVHGREHLTKIKVGTKGETPNFFPDKMISVRVAADLPASERIPVQVMKTDSKAFGRYIETLKSPTGEYPKACEIAVPTRLAP